MVKLNIGNTSEFLIGGTELNSAFCELNFNQKFKRLDYTAEPHFKAGKPTATFDNYLFSKPP